MAKLIWINLYVLCTHNKRLNALETGNGKRIQKRNENTQCVSFCVVVCSRFRQNTEYTQSNWPQYSRAEAQAMGARTNGEHKREREPMHVHTAQCQQQ